MRCFLRCRNVFLYIIHLSFGFKGLPSYFHESSKQNLRSCLPSFERKKIYRTVRHPKWKLTVQHLYNFKIFLPLACCTRMHRFVSFYLFLPYILRFSACLPCRRLLLHFTLLKIVSSLRSFFFIFCYPRPRFFTLPQNLLATYLCKPKSSIKTVTTLVSAGDGVRLQELPIAYQSTTTTNRWMDSGWMGTEIAEGYI